MTGPITWEQIAGLLGIGIGIAYAWWFLYSSILQTRRDLEEDVDRIRSDLAKYKVFVAERYASQEHLKEVEQRLVNAIDRLASQLDKMPDRLSSVIMQAMRKG